jgi:hypothetical protein
MGASNRLADGFEIEVPAARGRFLGPRSRRSGGLPDRLESVRWTGFRSRPKA